MGNEIYQALWEYQAADINLSRFERKLRESQTRKKLVAMRNYLLEQQKKVKQLEEDLLKGQRNAASIQEDIRKAMEEFAMLDQDLTDLGDDEDLEELRRISREMDALSKQLNGLNKELNDISKLAYGAEGVLKDAYVKMQKAKTDFDALKALHDKELDEAKGELNALQAAVAEKEKFITDPALLAEYKKIKKNRLNPLAKVNEDRCSGCNMTIPSLTLRKIKEGEGIIECESCGRILFME